MGGTTIRCSDANPCRSYDPCPNCIAQSVLTEEDRLILSFLRDCGGSTSTADALATCRAFGYPEELAGFLVSGVRMIVGLVNKTDQVQWLAECGKPYKSVTPEDVS